MMLVTLLPSSRRTRCRHASIPAAVPALVIRLPSSTNSTLRSTRAVGYMRASSSACIQCVVHARPSSRPAAPATNAPEHTVRIDRTRLGRRPQRRPAPPAGSDAAPGCIARAPPPNRRPRAPSRPCSGVSWAPTDVRSGLPGHKPAHPEVEVRDAVGFAVDAEHLADRRRTRRPRASSSASTATRSSAWQYFIP